MHSKIKKERPATSVKESGGRLSWCRQGCASTSISYPFCAFRHFAHRAFCAAAILLRAAGDIALLRAVIEATFGPLTFAHLARCAAAIRARPAADIVLPPVRLLPVPFNAESALFRLSI